AVRIFPCRLRFEQCSAGWSAETSTSEHGPGNIAFQNIAALTRRLLALSLARTYRPPVRPALCLTSYPDGLSPAKRPACTPQYTLRLPPEELNTAPTLPHAQSPPVLSLHPDGHLCASPATYP